MFNNKSVLITGGTGSLGKMLVKLIFERYPAVRKVIVFSRDE
ncbi:MAG: polysaccharide biosynthesis protein, partial [Minisyncoccia bacterium]